MTSGHFKPKAETAGSPALRLEIADQEDENPSPHTRAYPEPVHRRGYLDSD